MIWVNLIVAMNREQMLFRRVVVQVLTEPLLDFSNAHCLAFAVIGDLIAVNFAQTEISRLRMGEVRATHA